MKTFYGKKGLTLLELVVVATIFSILFTIGYLAYSRYTSETRDTVRMSHMKDIEKVLSLFKQEKGFYPDATIPTAITYSGSLVWNQGTFGQDTMHETGKIFGDIRDPSYKNEYTYSVTQSRGEYQIAAVFEKNNKLEELIGFDFYTPELIPETYASSTFDPSVFSPIIWLSSSDINGNGSSNDNPPNGAPVNAWNNKGNLGSAGDPTITGNVVFESGVLNGIDSVVIDENAGVLLNNSEITRGEIYYVLNKTNKAVGAGLRSVQDGYHIGPWHNCVDSVNINKSPEFYTNLSGGKKDPYFYSFYTDDENYVFRTNGNNLGFSGPTNSISGITWAFNAAGHDVESKSKKKAKNCSSAGSSSADIAVGEIMIFDSDVYELTEDDRLKIEGYLAWGWGLESKLPEDHPYKNAAPEGPTDEGEVQTIIPDSGVYVGGDFNGIITHSYTGSTHYVLASPSIITSDINNTDLQSIISNRKFVYPGYYNVPSSYSGFVDNVEAGFDFYSEYPLLYEGSKEELGSYNGLKTLNEQVRYKYKSSIVYPQIEPYLANHNLGYLEEILGTHIGINPIKPYFCSEILESKFVYNIAKEAGLSGDSSDTLGYGLPALVNGQTSFEGDLDKEYHSMTGDGFIELNWDEDKQVGFVRIFNSIQNSENLTDAVITLYDASDTIIYTHNIWNTEGDYLVDFDFLELGISIENARRLRLETTGAKPLHIREIEVYIGGNIIDGYYTVDSDGVGGKKPYQVYCDMTTDGGGWTKVGENFISYPNFELGNHSQRFEGYLGSGDKNIAGENTVISSSTITPPSGLDNAYTLRHSGDEYSYYELYFDDIPDVEFTSELRVGAWVKGSNKTPFTYEMKYQGQASQVYPYQVNTSIVNPNIWRYEEIRIPITDTLEEFRWQIGRGIDASVTPYDITGLSLELFYN